MGAGDSYFSTLLTTLLQENGQSTELADQVKASYKAQKSAMYASLKSQLLG